MTPDVNMIYGLLLIIFTVAFVYRYRRNQVRNRHVRELSSMKLEPLDTEHKVINDKLIVVSSITEHQLQDVLTSFCEARNDEAITVWPEMVVAQDNRLAVVFPYDIAYEVFCELLNYIVYPLDLAAEPIAIGWATYPTDEAALPKEMFDTPMMIFVPEEDQNYSQFFMINSSGIGCHQQLLDPTGYKVHQKPEEPYMYPPFDAVNVADWANRRIEIVAAN
jgi:hypothetical protein